MEGDVLNCENLRDQEGYFSRGGHVVFVHWGKAMSSVMDSLGSDGSENCHRRALQQCLSGTGERVSAVPARAGCGRTRWSLWEPLVVTAMGMLFCRKMDLFKT